MRVNGDAFSIVGAPRRHDERDLMDRRRCCFAVPSIDAAINQMPSLPLIMPFDIFLRRRMPPTPLPFDIFHLVFHAEIRRFTILLLRSRC